MTFLRVAASSNPSFRATLGSRMSKLRYLLGVMGLIFSSAALPIEDWQEPRAKKFALKVLLPGSYHGDEVPYSSGPGWYALVATGGSSKLEPVTLKIRWSYDALFDTDKIKGPYSGRSVDSEPRVNAILFVSGDILRAGEIPTATLVGTNRGVGQKKYTLGSRHYSLRLDKLCGKNETPCQWILSDGKSQQAIHGLNVTRTSDETLDTDSSNTGVVWAGDLDRDGKLDLIVDVSNHYNAVSQIRVFLSSKAKDGQLVGNAGWFSAVGC